MFAKENLLALLSAVTLVVAVLFATPAEAARVQPIENVENANVPSGLDQQAVRNAIIDGCSVRNWVAEEIEPGHMQCTVQVRKHTAKVDIRYNTENYSITYADSVELKYKDGKIHRNYNSWVMNLNGDINNALLKASR
jgi:hypothetical protein